MENTLSVTCLTTFLVTMSSVSLAGEWVPAVNNNSCAKVCSNANGTPVISGYFGTTKKPYLICRANADKGGNRGGYNLEPSWSDACWVGYGGDEVKVRPYDCLCNIKRLPQQLPQ